MQRTRFEARDWRALALLLAGWFALPLLLGAGARIPLNDDWAYAHTVRMLLETGEFRRPSWTWVPALTHTAWGALFAKAFGFGFPALRWSSLVAGALGIAGTFTLGRRLGLATGVAALLAATHGFNPIHVHLGFTFMSDAPFLALCVWSLVYLGDFARGGGWGALAAGIAFSVAATLSRQTALVLPAAFALALVIARPRDWRGWVAALACAAVVGFSYLRAEQWLFETGGRWARLYSVRDAGKFIAHQQSMLFHLVKHSLASLVVLGWFLAPVLLRVAAPLRLRLAASLLGAIAALALVLRLRLELPVSYNVIWDLGLGPLTIDGTQFLPRAPVWLWWGITALGAAAGTQAAALLLWRGLASWREWRKRGDVLLMIAFSAGFILPHLVRAPYFDRYAFTLVAPLGAALLVVASSGAAPAWRARSGLAVLAFFWLFAFVGTHDYLARSEAKWALLMRLRSEGYGERVVVGGIEYNGWFDDFDQLERSPKPDFVWDEEFVLTYASRQERYAPYAEMTYPRWLPPGDETVHALRRIRPQSAPAEHAPSR